MSKQKNSKFGTKPFGMGLDIIGRLRKISFTTNPLLPLFEAVINSIHSIEDAQISNGKIVVRIIRQQYPLFKNSNNKKKGEDLPPIIGFEIEDNGVGFTETNFRHFLTVDTTHKILRGGKGVGRLSWLKAFDEVIIDSSFLDDEGVRCNRAFVFSLKNHTQDDCIIPTDSQIDTDQPNRTIIRLNGYKSEYKDNCPKSIKAIVKRTFDHSIDYFLGGDCPEISFEDISGEIFSLNEYFNNTILCQIEKKQIFIGDIEFTIKHVRLSPKHNTKHTLFYSANRRTVISDDLSKYIPNLSSKLFQEDVDKFIYVAYVESSLLDEKVNEDRSNFSIPPDSNLQEGLNWKQIQSNVIENCNEYIAPFMSYVEQTKRERIEKFVKEQAPQYRTILKYAEKEIAQVSPDIDNDKLDLELYGVYQSVQKQIREEGVAVFAEQLSSNSEIDDYEAKIQSYLTKISDLNQSDLARYVCHRKIVLNYLQKCLEKDKEGNYKLERDIHSVIFPMIATSEDVPFADHNLWVIDEKLVYHSFLASDKPISSFMDCKSGKEPDIAIINTYDKALSFSNSPDGEPITSVVIVEFKKPMRKNYNDEDNPIAQIYGYIDDIREGKKTTKTGRLIQVSETTPFYCYLICHITTKIRQFAKQAGFTDTPDGQGLYCFNDNYKSYTEIISLDKLLNDAKKRQMAFFEKLNIR